MAPAQSDCRAISLRVETVGGSTLEAVMEKRKFGRTGLDVSLLGFGCGAVGGLMIKGAAADQERAVWRALAPRLQYFFTPPKYWDRAAPRQFWRRGEAVEAELFFCPHSPPPP